MCLYLPAARHSVIHPRRSQHRTLGPHVLEDRADPSISGWMEVDHWLSWPLANNMFGRVGGRVFKPIELAHGSMCLVHTRGPSLTRATEAATGGNRPVGDHLPTHYTVRSHTPLSLSQNDPTLPNNTSTHTTQYAHGQLTAPLPPSLSPPSLPLPFFCLPRQFPCTKSNAAGRSHSLPLLSGGLLRLTPLRRTPTGLMSQ